MADTTRRRYAEVMADVEKLVDEHIGHQRNGTAAHSKLKLLVPTIGNFFTGLALKDAFLYQDARRHISSRRFVAPSFNDIRIILNTAQVLSIARRLGGLQLITFDGDVTLYDDGDSLSPENKVIPRILKLMKEGVKVAIVTAAGYTEAARYYGRLYGLLDAVYASDMDPSLKTNLIVMGGESNFLFRYDDSKDSRLVAVDQREWHLEEMSGWTEKAVGDLLDVAERALCECREAMRLEGQIVRKARAVGIVPIASPVSRKFTREQLEETVMVTQKILELSPAGNRLPFCAFNGGNDVFVDIGDKSWGVLACQRFFGGIRGEQSLHVGDQFLSAGANDFKARLACTTAWIASPAETVDLLDEILAWA